LLGEVPELVDVMLGHAELHGFEAVQLRVAEHYINQFGNLAKQGNTLIVPANLTDVASMIGAAMSVIRSGHQPGPNRPPQPQQPPQPPPMA